MSKIISIIQAEKIAKQLKSQGEKIILTGGCFDLLHRGHIEFLEKSKKLGGKLIVLLESDEAVRKLKGKKRPIHTQKDRAFLLSKLTMVDYVILLPQLNSDKQYQILAKKINPDIITITRNDPKKVEKESQVKSVGGRLIEVMTYNRNYSTTFILKKLGIESK